MKGFTLVELIVAMAITLTITAATLSLVGPAHDAFQTQPETADLQQRARVGIDALQRDLLMAGAGMYAAGSVGPLHQVLAPVMPYRAFGNSPDTARGVFFRTDAISLLFVPSTASQTRLAAPMTAGALDIVIENPATCPAASASQMCGFASGDQLLVFDRASEWGVFSVDRVGGGATMTLKGTPPARRFDVQANVTEARAVMYSLRADAASGAFQLVRADGFDPAQPVLDHIVKLEFRYFGEPEPPRVLDEIEMPLRASYGPAPPPLEQPLPGWPAGENCTFALADGRYQTRLTTIGSPGTLVEIAPTLLTDGPWCPDAGAPNRFDADLLRIRRVRFTIRVQTALQSLRGPAGVLFTNGGLARAGGRYVPDLEIELDVTPRNLNLGPGTWNQEPGTRNQEPGT
jgi:prepilin-type N-terminal cleavage/methylation domain-containing protein